MEEEFLSIVKQQFHFYKSLGDKTIDQLTEEDIHFCVDAESNSIATLVKHLWGNMLSRWTDFLISDGEKEWRKRDAEFEDDIQSMAELKDKWEEGWNCVFTALDQVKESNVMDVVQIRKEPHTVVRAILRQYGHYSYHVGQMVYLAKEIKKEDWKSLSIPRNGSKEFNEKMNQKFK